MKLGFIVPLHFPERNRLESVLRELDRCLPTVSLVVVDDFDWAAQVGYEWLMDLTRDKELLPFQGNRGPTDAYNRGVLHLANRGCTHVCLLDQDSIPAIDFCSIAIGSIASDPEAIFATMISSGRNLFAPWIGSLFVFSGTIIPTEVFWSFGLFDSSYRVDFADFEYSLRTRGHVRLRRLPGARLDHQLGQPLTRKLCGFTVSGSRYPAARRYEKAANRLRLARQYAAIGISLPARMVVGLLHDLLDIVMFDLPRQVSVLSWFRGIIKGVFSTSIQSHLAVSQTAASLTKE